MMGQWPDANPSTVMHFVSTKFPKPVMLNINPFLAATLLNGPGEAATIDVESDDVFDQRKLKVELSLRYALMVGRLVLPASSTSSAPTSRRVSFHPSASGTSTTRPNAPGNCRSSRRNEAHSCVLATTPKLRNAKQINILAEPRSKFRPRTEKESFSSAHYA